MNMKHILGTVTILVIIGGTVYAIKKAKDQEKTEGEEISLAEAKKMVADRQVTGDFDEEFDTYFEKDKSNVVILDNNILPIDLVEYSKEDVRITARLYNALEELTEDEEEDYEDIDETIEGPMIEPGESSAYIKPIEEDEELRYEPNSKDARNQFIKMELAEWVPLEDTYATLLKLYEFPFKPQNDGDDMLRTQIIDFRAQFFGYGSKWTQEVTVADIIIHYAKAAEFNIGESVRYWVEYFLEFNELDFTQSSRHIDSVLNALNSHTYFNEERQTFGLFGLSRNYMDQAIKIANRNIDGSVTYEIEFNEFLKSCL